MMGKFVCLFLLLFYHSCYGYQIEDEITDDADIIGHIENLIRLYNNLSSTDETQHSPAVSMQIQNATHLLHHLEHQINQSNTTANHSERLDSLKIMFSKIGAKGGGSKGGGSKGGGSKGGGSKGGGSKGGGGSKTRVGGGHYRPNTRSSGGSDGGGWVFLGLVVGGIVIFVLGYAILHFIEKRFKKEAESTKM